MSDIYQQITDRIIAELEKGKIPWHCPWRPREWRHRNLVSKKEYRGINTILLCMTPYESPFWLSMRQIKKLGGVVKPNETGTCIVFWTLYEKDTENKFPVLRYYTVFNIEQIRGIPAKYIPLLSSKENIAFNPIESAEEIIAGYEDCPLITHFGNHACYIPYLDCIKMPQRIQFENEEEYYSTLFHELVHSTGHKSRLTRPGMDNIEFGSETYSKEELIAEMGAAFLCAQTGIEQATIKNSTAYIQNWLDNLKNNKKLVVQAAQKAQKAVDYINKPQNYQELEA